MEIIKLNKKRGLIFSLDAAIAVTVVVIILITSAYYLSTASKESTSQVQLIRMGNDLLHILEFTGALDNAVKADIGSPPYSAAASPTATISTSLVNVSQYLPASYKALIEISDIKESLISDTTITNCSSLPAPNPISCCSLLGCNGSFNVSTLPLNRAGNYHLLVHTRAPPSNITPFISGIKGNVSVVLSILDYNRFASTYPVPFSLGINSDLRLNVSYGVADWFKILGENAYSANTSIKIPNNLTFMGTGERLFAYVIQDFFDQPRYARFYIWIE